MSEPLSFPDLSARVSRALNDAGEACVLLELPRRNLRLDSSAAYSLGQRLVQIAQSTLAERFLTDWCLSNAWEPADARSLAENFRTWMEQVS